MATNEQSNEPDIHIEDEEFVDKRVKKRILDSRDQVNELEDQLFTRPVVDPEVNISRRQAVVAWGNTVRRYMRDVEVILERMDIPGTDYYLNNVELGVMTLVPPDKNGYRFSEVANADSEDYDSTRLRRRIGLPPGGDIPWSEKISFEGLVSIIERDPIAGSTWTVVVDDSGAPPSHERVYLETQEPVPKWIYENAIRAADRFLWDAGMSLNIEASEYEGETEEPGL